MSHDNEYLQFGLDDHQATRRTSSFLSDLIWIDLDSDPFKITSSIGKELVLDKNRPPTPTVFLGFCSPPFSKGLFRWHRYKFSHALFALFRRNPPLCHSRDNPCSRDKAFSGISSLSDGSFFHNRPPMRKGFGREKPNSRFCAEFAGSPTNSVLLFRIGESELAKSFTMRL